MKVKPSTYNPTVDTELAILESFLGTQSKVAEVLNVNKSMINRWSKSVRPDRDNLTKIFGLNFIISKLLSIFKHPRTALSWLNGTNPDLNYQRPLDLIAKNRISEVASAIDQLELDSYA